jgi:hypothetical protein
MITPENTKKIQLARTLNEVRMNSHIVDPLQSRRINRDLAISSNNPWLVLSTDAELTFAEKSGALPVTFVRHEEPNDRKILKLHDMSNIIGRGEYPSIQKLLEKPRQHWLSSGLEPEPIEYGGGVVPFVRDCLGVIAVSNGPNGAKLNGIHRTPAEHYGVKDIEELLDAHRNSNTISIGIAGGENKPDLLRSLGAQFDNIPQTKNDIRNIVRRVLGPDVQVRDIEARFHTGKHLTDNSCMNHTLYGNTEGIRCNSAPIGF